MDLNIHKNMSVIYECVCVFIHTVVGNSYTKEKKKTQQNNCVIEYKQRVQVSGMSGWKWWNKYPKTCYVDLRKSHTIEQ